MRNMLLGMALVVLAGCGGPTEPAPDTTGGADATPGKAGVQSESAPAPTAAPGTNTDAMKPGAALGNK